MWAYPTRKEVGWFFDEKINQTVFKCGKLSYKVQARFEEIGKWLKVHCEPQIMELERSEEEDYIRTVTCANRI